MLFSRKMVSVTNPSTAPRACNPSCCRSGRQRFLAARWPRRRASSVRSRGAQGAGGGARCGRLPAAAPRPAADDPRCGAMQRIGVTGILKGRGANVGWENQAVRRRSTIAESELREGLRKSIRRSGPPFWKLRSTGRSPTAMLAEALGKPAEGCCGADGACRRRTAVRLTSGASAHAARMRAADRRGGRSHAAEVVFTEPSKRK